MRQLRTALHSAALLAFGTCAANATVITGNQVFSVPLPALFAPASPGHPSAANVNLSQFDILAKNAAIQIACPSGHACSTLTFIGIDFEVIVDSLGTLIFSNANATSRTVSHSNTLGFAAQGILDFTMMDPNLVVVNEAIPTFEAVAAFTVPGFGSTTKSGTGHVTETGNIDVATGDVVLSNGPSDTLTLSQILLTYVGNGAVTFALAIDGSALTTSLSTGVTITTNSEELTGVSAGITYSYSYNDEIIQLPEPATFALFGGALLFLGLRRKRSV